MKVGILGTGNVGKALAKGFAGIGYEVMIGSRDPSSEKVLGIIAEIGDSISAGTFAEAAAFGDLAVLCTLWTGAENAIRLATPANLAGKVVIDATNPLDFSKGMPPGLLIGHNDSAGEQVQRWLPDSFVVKAFNIATAADMVNPDYPGGPPDMFIGGNDKNAKAKVTEILTAFGWPTFDLGGIEASRVLEPLCIFWVLYGAASGGWRHAIKMLRK